MKKLIMISVGAVFVVSFCFGAALAEEMSLKSLLAEAVANNPSLKADKQRTMGKEARVAFEASLEDPVFSIEFEDIPEDDISLGSSETRRYTLSQSFPFPGKRSLKKTIAGKEASAYASGYDASVIEVKYLVKEAYFACAYLFEAITVAEDIKKTLEDMSAIASVRYSTGKSLQQDLIKINVETALAQKDVIEFSAEKDAAVARLKTVLGRPIGSPLGGRAVLSRDRAVFDGAFLLKSALLNNPELGMVKKELEAGELSVKLAAKEYYPDFMVSVSPMERDGGIESYDFMFGLNIPLWFGKNQSRLSEARANAEALRAVSVARANDKSSEVAETIIRVTSGADTLTLYETALLPQSELSLESAMKNYRSFDADFISLLDSERELKRMRLDYLKTLLEYRKAVASLERAVGEDFENFEERERR